MMPWTVNEDWEKDDVPAWLPVISINDEQENDDGKDEGEGWEEDDDLAEVIDPL